MAAPDTAHAPGMVDFGRYLFARGYIIAEGIDPVAPEGWLRQRFHTFRICYDPRVETVKCRSGGVTVLCIGLLFDVRYPWRGMQECIAALASALEASKPRFFKELAFACGRYVILYGDRESEHILTDATGMKMAMYHDGETRVVGSHVDLILRNVPEKLARDRKFWMWGYPGNRTPVEGITLLTPNTRLNLRTFKVKRYWPRAPIPGLPIGHAADTLAQTMRNAFRHLLRRHNPLISLTAGIDSRTTLAISRGKARYFTYYRSDDRDTDALDRDFAIAIRDRFGIEHDLLTPRIGKPMPSGYQALLEENTALPHIRTLSFRYFERYGDRDFVHVRSNLSEIGRQFYQYRWSRLNKASVETADDLCHLWDPERKSEMALAAFREFADATDFFDCARFVDLTDLFYWEHRMGAWHSQLVLESDPAFETVSLYNCRHVLQTMLSVAIRERRRATLFKRVIAQEWPELTEYPINGRPFQIEAADSAASVPPPGPARSP